MAFYWKKLFFLFVYSPLLCHRWIDYRSLGLFLDCQLYSMDLILCVLFITITVLSDDSCCSLIGYPGSLVCPFQGFSPDCIDYLAPLCFHTFLEFFVYNALRTSVGIWERKHGPSGLSHSLFSIRLCGLLYYTHLLIPWEQVLPSWVRWTPRLFLSVNVIVNGLILAFSF